MSFPLFSTISPFDHTINGLCAPPEVCGSSGLQSDNFVRFDHENSRRMFVISALSHARTVPNGSLSFTPLYLTSIYCILETI